MKKLAIPLIIIISIIFLVGNASAETITSFVYQEFANATNTSAWTDVDVCSGDGCENDGNWSTLAYGLPNYLYENYTKPNNLNGVIWALKDIGYTFNVTIPSDCLSQTPLQLLVSVSSTGEGGENLYQCFNGTDWLLLQNNTFVGADGFYEDGVYWNITGITTCQTLSIANGYYTLQNDITNAPSTCFTMGVDNITLDCSGHTIDGDQSGTDYGIYLNGKDNITVKNCTIKEFYYGIYGTSGSDIINLDTIKVSDSTNYGIYASTSQNYVMTNIETYNNTRYEIYFDRINNTYLENVNVHDSRATSTAYPIYYLGVSKDHILKNVLVHDNALGSYSLSGIRTTAVNNITIYNATVYNLGVTNHVTYTANGIELSNTNNSIVDTCEVYNTSIRGLNLVNDFNNLVKDSYFHAYDGADYGGQDVRVSVSAPIFCDNTFENVRITGNRTFYFFNYSTTIENVEVGAIHLCDADGSVVRNITLISPLGSLGHYLRLEYTDNTNISDVRINGGLWLVYYSFNIKANNIDLNNTYEHMHPAITGTNICNRFPVIILNSTIEVNNLNIHDSNYGICVTAGFPVATITNTKINVINESLRVDGGTSSGDSYTNFYDSSLQGLVNMTCVVGGCTQQSFINLYNTTYDSHEITINFTSLNIFWKLAMTNPLNASVKIYNQTGDEVASFSDSRSIWLENYYVKAVNTLTNSTPHSINITKSGYNPNSSVLVMNTNKEYTVYMTATSVPFVNQLPNIVVQLVLTLGFGIMGLFTILALLYYGDYNDPQTLIKVMVAIVIIILMIVGVWQGLFLI